VNYDLKATQLPFAGNYDDFDADDLYTKYKVWNNRLD
jgi:hypothetical protein